MPFKSQNKYIWFSFTRLGHVAPYLVCDILGDPFVDLADTGESRNAVTCDRDECGFRIRAAAELTYVTHVVPVCPAALDRSWGLE